MPNFKSNFFRITSPLVNTFNLRIFQRFSNQKFILPLYHCIRDTPPAHLKYLYHIKNPDAFINDLELLLKYYHPISLEELIQIVNNRKEITKSVFHLTFDDGLSEFESVIAPILLKKGIPATCFLNSDFIDNKKIFFRFKASILIDKLHNSEAGSETWAKYHKWQKENDFGNTYYRKILLKIGYEKQNLLDALAAKLDIDFKAYLKKNKPYLEKSQIEYLIKKGFTFGAHSVDHPEYRYISKNEQIEQTLNSIKNITETFGLSYKVFSFPFTDHDVSVQFFNSIKSNIDLSFGCAGIKKDAIPFNVQRIPVEEHKFPLKTVLKNEFSYYMILKTLRKHIIQRS